MKKFFNTTGPCNPEQHYMLPPKDRLIGADLERYLEYHLYWVLHAPRQTGKTTFLRAWMKEINEGEQAIACYVSIERCQSVPTTEKCMPALVEAIIDGAKMAEVPIPSFPSVSPESMLNATIREWSEICAPKPLIILFDEVDVLEGTAMVSFLRQLRGGFPDRGIGKFPTSIALVGMRDLRDYLAKSKDGLPVNPGSPFNIKENSTSISNFAHKDIKKLTDIHTQETGQQFDSEAIERIWYWTHGQPWLVNALCKHCVWQIVPQESKETVLAEHIEQAKERLILSRATHIDSLSERLKEERVRRVVEPILSGTIDITLSRNDSDVEYCMDLGLVIWEDGFKIANPIYQGVVARSLAQGYQDNIPKPEFTWQKENGSLDMDALLEEFQDFWAWHSESWETKAQYTEAFPHLLLTAFLQRVINGGGQVHREYGTGRGRMDILIVYKNKNHLIEIKLVHPRMGREKTRDKGIEQISKYADQTQADTCHLVIFDRRPEWKTQDWEKRLGWETIQVNNRHIEVVWG